jgi:hypothetical protein
MQPIQRLIGFVALLGFCLSLANCVGIYDRAEIYTTTQTATIGGANIGLEFVPFQSESSIAISAMVVAAAESRSRGPYRIAVYAVGSRGRFTHLTVTRLQMVTPNGRSWDVPSNYLQREEYFMSTRQRRLSQATFILPPFLDLNLKTHGQITVTADVVIKAADGKVTKGTATFICDRQKQQSFQSCFIPVEIVDSIRMNDVPEEHTEIGANRKGWKPAP